MRVSTRQQSTDRQQADLLAAGVRHDDLYVDHGTSGARASRPQFDRALDALIDGNTLVITALDRLGRSTQKMLAFADELRGRGAGLRISNLGGGDVDTATPMWSMLFTIMAALAQTEHEIKRERVTDSSSKRREAGKRPRRVTDSQIRSPVRLVEGGEPAAQVARDPGMSEQRSIGGRELSRTSHVASSALKATPSDHPTPPRSDQFTRSTGEKPPNAAVKNRHYRLAVTTLPARPSRRNSLALVWHQIGENNACGGPATASPVTLTVMCGPAD
jgi:DNA invertase Pin-like site-specific DNA recombinase